jgi:hypothetical protein
MCRKCGANWPIKNEFKNLVGNKNLNNRLNLHKSQKCQFVDRIWCSDDKV